MPRQDYPGGFRESWQPGDRAFFEYHCNQAHDSAHAQWWYRSHQPVTVLEEISAPEDYTDEDGTVYNFLDRGEAGAPRCYRVRWDDGAEGTVFEDELLTSSRHKYPQGFEEGGFGPPADWRERIGPMEE